jgi:glycosyltransferase involved in cell wall biosynthesis
MYRSSVPATIAAHFAKVPVVFSQVHNVGTWESNRQAGMDRFLTRWRAGTIAVSKSVQTDVCQTLGLPKNKVPVLYNGSDTDKFHPDEQARERGRRSLEVEENRPLILVPARLHSNKNPEGVLKAFLAAREELENDPILVYAGPGPLTDHMKALITEKQCTHCVRLLGSRDDMVDLYNACDVMVLSTFKEGFSNSIVEALACGKPVIAADVGGNAEAIDRSEVGWIHKAGDTETLAKQMVDALSNLSALKEKSEACRQQGLRFSLDALVDQTDQLYRTALKDAGII